MGQPWNCPVPRLDEQLKMSHPLVTLSKLMNWDEIERSFGAHFTSSRGRPALSPRLVAGLLYLQHANDASDEAVVATWLENPCWQYFCGETYLQTELPIDPSSLTRWRKRIGEEGVEVLLTVTIMPKAIAHPTNSQLLEKNRQHLVRLADEHHLPLRQNLQSDRRAAWPRKLVATRMQSSTNA